METPVSTSTIVYRTITALFELLLTKHKISNYSKQIWKSLDAVATPEEQAILAPIYALFDGVAKRDKKAMLDVLLPSGATTVIMDGHLFQFSLTGLADRLPTGTRKIEERIYDPLIRIDEDIAMVWARYEFLIDGQVAQFGTDLFNLIHFDDRWLIAGVTYNSHTRSNGNVNS